MKKIIRLTENELNTLIKESVNRVLKNNVINLSESAGVNNTMFIVSDKIAENSTKSWHDKIWGEEN